MLNCVYHPVDNMRVVDDKERDKLLASGVWFDTPQEAKAKRLEAEKNIEAKKAKPKPKPKGDKQ